MEINNIDDINKYFEDVVQDKYGVWSPICSSCLQKFQQLDTVSYEGSPANGTVCGVIDCQNPADTYIDFHFHK